jgi:redox-sensitive bicupin YhaK (pirin superfamily)
VSWCWRGASRCSHAGARFTPRTHSRRASRRACTAAHSLTLGARLLTPRTACCVLLSLAVHRSAADARAEHTRGRPNFGVLRVCNDDLVQPARGFGTHPHANAEIATYIISGALTHADSMGTSDTLERGGVQFMTAGRGVRHSERNASASAPLRFIQLWFTPRATGLPPNYGSFAGDAAARRDAWAHLVGDVADAKRQPPVKFNADANIYVTELSPGAVLTFPLAAGRQAYLLACEGDARVGARTAPTCSWPRTTGRRCLDRASCA